MFTIENFINGMRKQNLFMEEENGNYLIMPARETFEPDEVQKRKIGEIPQKDLESIVEELSNDFSFRAIGLQGTSSLEIAVEPSNPMIMANRFRVGRSAHQISEHNFDFSVRKASTRYIFALVCYSGTHSEIELDLIRSYRIAQQDNINSVESLFDLFRITTIAIIAPREYSMKEFMKMFHSYVFNISYNENITYSVADLSERRRSYRRRMSRQGQKFPYKSYKTELTKYYHQAISVDNPFTQYLAFYHVVEYFFQSISEQDVYQEIVNFITRPSFSPYKKSEIEQFYSKIRKKMKEQRDDGVWNEKTGLLLCLKKYVTDFEVLKDGINSIDSSAINYYSETFVPFADESKTINFEDTEDKVYNDIRSRVYSVRNSIVHSKEGQKLRYEPFKHDKTLAKEIPLIRAIAEEIIVNSAEPIQINFDL